MMESDTRMVHLEHTKKLRVLYLASEAEPFVKIGGLGDVAGSLPHALASITQDKIQGYQLEVRVVIPYHSAVRKKINQPIFEMGFEIPYRNSTIPAQAFRAEINHIPAYLISGEPIPYDGPVYSQDSHLDSEKYIFFSLAALEFANRSNWIPDIIHANDWHTAIAVYALKGQTDCARFFTSSSSVLCIHNLPYMGSDCRSILRDYHLCSLQDDDLPDWAQRVPLPLGIATADHIATVSPTYAREILTPEYGCGLDSYLVKKADKITGILNGINYDDWNPQTDLEIFQNYSLETLDLRQKNKQNLLEKLNLPYKPDVPLLIMVTRMDYQKGIDIAIDALREIIDADWQVVFLGSGDPNLENQCRSLEGQFPSRVRASIRYDAVLARRMYSSGDILMMPSRYEPCGLSQMIAMRYGCVPIATATGGLFDTIIDHENPIHSTGFLAHRKTPPTYAQTLHKAILLYQLQPQIWRTIQKNAMLQDFSWEKSALTYANLYFKLRGLT